MRRRRTTTTTTGGRAYCGQACMHEGMTARSRTVSSVDVVCSQHRYSARSAPRTSRARGASPATSTPTARASS
eukprot:5504711-Alexandrium_andersonii.AAC.1